MRPVIAPVPRRHIRRKPLGGILFLPDYSRMPAARFALALHLSRSYSMATTAL